MLAAFVGGLGLGARFVGRRVDRGAPAAPLRALEIAAALWALLVPAGHRLARGPVRRSRERARRAGALGAARGPRRRARGARGDAARRDVPRRRAVVGPAGGACAARSPSSTASTRWARSPARCGPGFLGILRRWACSSRCFSPRRSRAVVGVRRVVRRSQPRPRRAQPADPSNGAGPLAHVPPLLQAPPGRYRAARSRARSCAGSSGWGSRSPACAILVFFVEGFTPSFAAMLGVFLAGLGVGSLVLGTAGSRARRTRARRAPCLLAGRPRGVAAAFGFRPAGGVQWSRGSRRSRRAYARRDGRGGPAPRRSGRRARRARRSSSSRRPCSSAPRSRCACAGRGVGARRGPRRASGRVYLVEQRGRARASALLTRPRGGRGRGLGAWRAAGLSRSFAAWSSVLAAGARLAALAGARARGLAVGWSPRSAVSGSTPRRRPGSSPSSRLRAAPGRSGSLARASRCRPTSPPRACRDGADGERILYTDDFAAAATGTHYPYMRMLGHLPALARARPENALVIAFGTGTTAGAVATHSDVRAPRDRRDEPRRARRSPPRFRRGQPRRARRPARARARRRRPQRAAAPRARPRRDHARAADAVHARRRCPSTRASSTSSRATACATAACSASGCPSTRCRSTSTRRCCATFFEMFPDGSLWFFEQSTALIGARRAAPDAATVRAARFGRARGRFVAAGYPTPELLPPRTWPAAPTVLARRVRGARAPTVSSRTMSPCPSSTRRLAGLTTSLAADTLEYLVRSPVRTLRPHVPSVARPRRSAPARGCGSARAALQARMLEAQADLLRRGGRRGALRRAGRPREAADVCLGEAGRSPSTARTARPATRSSCWAAPRARRGPARCASCRRRDGAPGAAGQGRWRTAALDEPGARAVVARARARRRRPRGLAARRRRATHALVLLRLGRCAAAEKALRDADRRAGRRGRGPGPAGRRRRDPRLRRGRVAGTASRRTCRPAAGGPGLAAAARRRPGAARSAAARSARSGSPPRTCSPRRAAESAAGGTARRGPARSLPASARRARVAGRLLGGSTPPTPRCRSCSPRRTRDRRGRARGGGRFARAARAARPSALDALARSPEPAVREALASALGADGGAREIARPGGPPLRREPRRARPPRPRAPAARRQGHGRLRPRRHRRVVGEGPGAPARDASNAALTAATRPMSVFLASPKSIIVLSA